MFLGAVLRVLPNSVSGSARLGGREALDAAEWISSGDEDGEDLRAR